MSEVKVNKISPRTACGTTTLGDSGDTFTIPAGVTITNNGTQTGFGREGSVNWQTSIKTATFTAASGEGYFCNTSGGAFTVNLPSSPSVGDIVAIKDYGSSFATNNLTIGRGGSNMNGSATDFEAATDNLSLTLVYADATKGWLSVEEGTGFIGENFMEATGGAITTSGNCKIHTFTGPGTFTVCSVATTAANNVVSYVVVAGGGGGKNGGGGAGGFREYKSSVTPYTASPLDGNPGGTAITVTAQGYPITVGGGGGTSTKGSNSIFSTITSTGGGLGGNFCGSQPGGTGGSGGGGGGGPNPGSGAAPGGAGNTPPVSPSQGFPGGSGYHACGSHFSGGGGGGATTAGASKPSGPAPQTPFGNGGTGATTSINGSATAFAGGGGAQCNYGTAGTGGTGGGGNGSGNNPGTTNTGGGGGGSGSGGSGIVIIRYKFQ
jgi:hypothetical protein